MTTEATAKSNGKTTRLAVLISGKGSNCLAIARAIRDGRLPQCEIAVVICNVPGAAGIEAARHLGLNVVTLEGRGREQRDHEEAIAALLRKFRVDMLCLAGYKRVLSAAFVREWRNRILNIHPSLLPAFPGYQSVQQALDYGVRFTGCTVYFVEETVEGGPVIMQRVIEVEDGDTSDSLADALRMEEHIAYTEAIARVLSGEYEIRGRRYVRRQESETSEDTSAGYPSEVQAQA